MPQILIQPSFALGLYVYLQQAELSVDRVLRQPWQMLYQFYQSEERIMPGTVIKVLEEVVENLSSPENRLEINLIAPTSFLTVVSPIRYYKILARIWNWHVRKLVVLNDEQFLFIYQSIMELNRLLNLELTPNLWQIGSLRQNLSLAEMILESHMLFGSICKRARRVEHLNQNEYLTFLKFSEIVGNTQLEWIKEPKPIRLERV